jgi:hypothetical protein
MPSEKTAMDGERSGELFVSVFEYEARKFGDGLACVTPERERIAGKE